MAQQIVTLDYIGDKTQRSTCTLTGASGTANIAVAGTNYLATWTASLTGTASAFVTSHAATILAAKGIIVESAGAKLIFTAVTAREYFTLTAANASGDLAGTIALGLIDEEINIGTDSIVTVEDMTSYRLVSVDSATFGRKNLKVLTAYSTIATDGNGSLIEVTPFTDVAQDAILINANRLQALLEYVLPDTNDGAKVFYSNGGNAAQQLITEETPAEIETLVDAL